MGSLVEFAKRIEGQLSAANRQPLWEPDQAKKYMTDVTARRERFEQLETRLISKVIQPRLETLAGYFSNASLTKGEPPGNCSCWFGYCERFPTSTKVSFSVEHDVRFEKVSVCYDASMMPVFIKFHEHDKLPMLLDEVNDNTVAEWVEERLLEFLDVYLRIDRGGENLGVEPVTDPVCGMRFSRSSAAASGSYRGHPYYFCSGECREKFDRDPTKYVEVKVI